MVMPPSRFLHSEKRHSIDHFPERQLSPLNKNGPTLTDMDKSDTSSIATAPAQTCLHLTTPPPARAKGVDNDWLYVGAHR